jgi:hypothetical protein
VPVIFLALLSVSFVLGSNGPATRTPRDASASALGARPISPFWEIHAPDPTEYATYQLKFTYLGDQKKAVPSLAVVGDGRAYDATAFTLFERDLDYRNDEATPDTLLLPHPEFKAFVDAIAAHPALTDTTFDPDPDVSLMILRDFGPQMRCWEHLATRAETDTLFQLLRDQILNPADTATVSAYRRQMAGVRR